MRQLRKQGDVIVSQYLLGAWGGNAFEVDVIRYDDAAVAEEARFVSEARQFYYIYIIIFNI